LLAGGQFFLRARQEAPGQNKQFPLNPS